MQTVRSHADEGDESLWWLAAGPALWAVHFLTTYVTVAIACAKLGTSGLGGGKTAVYVYTAVFGGAAVAVAVRGYRRFRQREDHRGEHDTPRGRLGFMGLATLLLGGLAVLAIVFVTVPVLYTETCR